MKFIKQTTWEEVYNTWKEAEKATWKEHKNRQSFKDWESFRAPQIAMLKNFTWSLNEITPLHLHTLECGDFTHWNKLAQEKETRLLKDLAQAEHFKNHPKIQALAQNFPSPTHLISTKNSLLEGHHRAITLIQNPHLKTKLFIYKGN